ncbi:uncharacterized protein METZ01_LOCUS323975 [marine metagenome]|uniref:Uncharacterized protein n=1 Tax=marine metagenome TaxID=408172 RepID=A0A382PGS0_9ZZZZ
MIKPMSKEPKKKIERLREDIRQYDFLYYVKDNPIISDRKYDLLMQELKGLERKFPRVHLQGVSDPEGKRKGFRKI